MDDREVWWERVRNIHADSTTWWWQIYSVQNVEMLNEYKFILIDIEMINKQKILLYFFSVNFCNLFVIKFIFWFISVFPFVRNPEDHPVFSMHFTRHWQETYFLSLHNFLSTVLQVIHILCQSVYSVGKVLEYAVCIHCRRVRLPFKRCVLGMTVNCIWWLQIEFWGM